MRNIMGMGKCEELQNWLTDGDVKMVLSTLPVATFDSSG
jgi:hypothetical protein